MRVLIRLKNAMYTGSIPSCAATRKLSCGHKWVIEGGNSKRVHVRVGSFLIFRLPRPRLRGNLDQNWSDACMSRGAWAGRISGVLFAWYASLDRLFRD